MPLAKIPRIKICINCSKNFLSVHATEKICPKCRPEQRKLFRRMNVKRWRDKMGKEELRKYRRQEYLRNILNYKKWRDAYRDKVRFGGLKQPVLKRDNFKCVECDTPKNLSIHHINGKGRSSKNPDNRMENLQTLCHKCHAIKDGAKTWFKKGHPRLNISPGKINQFPKLPNF